MELGLGDMVHRITLILYLFSISLSQEFENLSNNQIPDLIDDVGSAVVMLLADGDNYKDRALGSGVIVNNGEYVITNAHVVSGARKVVIKFFDGSQQTFYGYSSEDKRRDLVSIKIKENDNIKSVDLRESTSVKVGESVVAIGNPQGLSHSVSEGIISGKREFEKGIHVLQTTSPISPGSSGGGLFDLNGNLIGITSFLHKGGQNLNFAYPTEFIIPLLQHDYYLSFKKLSRYKSNQTASDDVNVYVTKTGKKYHKYGCSYLRKSLIPIKITEAAYKYKPCSRCFK